jgi:hypothetical protein
MVHGRIGRLNVRDSQPGPWQGMAGNGREWQGMAGNGSPMRGVAGHGPWPGMAESG